MTSAGVSRDWWVRAPMPVFGILYTRFALDGLSTAHYTGRGRCPCEVELPDVRRQTRLTPQEGGRFADPVGPDPELVAEIRAMTPEMEMERRLAAQECTVKIKAGKAEPAWGKQPVTNVDAAAWMADPWVPTWTPKVGDWVRSTDNKVRRLARREWDGVWCADDGYRDYAMDLQPWTPRVGERVRSTRSGLTMVVDRVNHSSVLGRDVNGAIWVFGNGAFEPDA